MAHAPAGLLAKPTGDHFIIRKQRAVKEQHVGFADAGVELLRNMRTAGRIDEARASRIRRDADCAFAEVVEADFPVLEPQRNLAGDGEQFDLEAWKGFEGLAEPDRAARCDGAIDGIEHPIGPNRLKGRLRAENLERLALTQRQEAGRRIDLGVGQDDGGDRRMAAVPLRLERRRRQDLLTQIDRGVEQ